MSNLKQIIELIISELVFTGDRKQLVDLVTAWVEEIYFGSKKYTPPDGEFYVMMYSVVHGHLDLVKQLINIVNDDVIISALVESADNGHLGVVQVLVENGANIFAKHHC